MRKGVPDITFLCSFCSGFHKNKTMPTVGGHRLTIVSPRLVAIDTTERNAPGRTASDYFSCLGVSLMRQSTGFMIKKRLRTSVSGFEASLILAKGNTYRTLCKAKTLCQTIDFMPARYGFPRISADFAQFATSRLTERSRDYKILVIYRQKAFHAFFAALLPSRQIGRASCRERVSVVV